MGPFGVIQDQEIGIGELAALLRFPSLVSCLHSESRLENAEALTAENLWNFRWSSFRTKAEMHVCLWHLAVHMKEARPTADWFGDQGFRTKVRHFDRSSTNPARVVVDASWDLIAFGPRSGCCGFFGSFTLPYSMVVTSHWSEDGKQLLTLRVGYNAN